MVQVAVKVSASQHEALVEACKMLQIDMSNLLRLMISQHVGEYIAMGRRGVQDLEQARRRQPSKPLLTDAEANDRNLDLGDDSTTKN